MVERFFEFAERLFKDNGVLSEDQEYPIIRKSFFHGYLGYRRYEKIQIYVFISMPSSNPTYYTELL